MTDYTSYQKNLRKWERELQRQREEFTITENDLDADKRIGMEPQVRGCGIDDERERELFVTRDTDGLNYLHAFNTNRLLYACKRLGHCKVVTLLHILPQYTQNAYNKSSDTITFFFLLSLFY